MLITLLLSKSDRQAAPGWDNFDSLEIYIYFNIQYFKTKFEMLIKLMYNYWQRENQQNWFSNKNYTLLFHEIFYHPSYLFHITEIDLDCWKVTLQAVTYQNCFLGEQTE